MPKKILSTVKREWALRVFATICFVILLVLQYKLLSSSYEIENREIAKAEKEVVRQHYEQGIINDKLYPGGQNIIDKFLGRGGVASLEEISKVDKRKFRDSLTLITDQVIKELRQQSNMDSLLTVALESLRLNLNGYGYALTIDDIAITFDGENYINLLDNEHSLPVLIDGDSSYIDRNDIISSISVNSYSPYSYMIKFSFYGLDLSQNLKVFKKIFPLLALVAICVFVIAGTYVATFSSWQKQKKLNEISQDFLNSITHEFKTPISSISVSVKNLYRETRDYKNQQITQSIQVIDRQSKRIDHLVDQAIGISSFNPHQASREYHNLTDDLEKVVYDLRLKYVHDQTISIIFEADVQEVFATYDLFYFTTAVNNLIENGIKHNDSPQRNVVVRLTDDQTEIILEIIDNGFGIIKEERKHVFRKFYQGQRGKEKGGLGLGLYYVDQMVKVHGWQLAIDDWEGGGTHVKIMISKT